jgi:hypothetical protein
MKKNRRFAFGFLESYVGYLLINENNLPEHEFKWPFIFGTILGVLAVIHGVNKMQETL